MLCLKAGLEVTDKKGLELPFGADVALVIDKDFSPLFSGLINFSKNFAERLLRYIADTVGHGYLLEPARLSKSDSRLIILQFTSR